MRDEQVPRDFFDENVEIADRVLAKHSYLRQFCDRRDVIGLIWTIDDLRRQEYEIKRLTADGKPAKEVFTLKGRFLNWCGAVAWRAHAYGLAGDLDARADGYRR